MDRLTNEYKKLVRNSWRLFYLSHRVWAKAMEEMGLSTATYAPLELIVQNPGVTQQEISEELSIDKSCTSRSCRFLEDNGFIRKVKNDQCTHGFKCYPTEKAIETYTKVLDIENRHIHALFESIDTQELEASNELLRQLIERLNTQQ